MTHTFRTLIQGLVLLAWLIGGAPPSHAAQDDLMAQGPASISDLIVQEQVNGRWRLATELRRGNKYRFRYTVVNRNPLKASDTERALKVGPHKATGKFELYDVTVHLDLLGDNCYGGGLDSRFGFAAPEDRHQRLTRGHQSLHTYFEFTWNCKKANAFALKQVPAVWFIGASVTAELDHPTSPVPLSPNQQSSLKWKIGQFCANHKQCTTRRCDTGAGSKKTHRCIAKDGTGKDGEYCNHRNQCRPGYSCSPQSPTNLNLTCHRPAPVNSKGIGQSCSNHQQCTTGRCDRGAGSKKTNRCIAKDGTGRKSEYCNHTNQCRPGLKCFPKDPSRPKWWVCQ